MQVEISGDQEQKRRMRSETWKMFALPWRSRLLGQHTPDHVGIDHVLINCFLKNYFAVLRYRQTFPELP